MEWASVSPPTFQFHTHLLSLTLLAAMSNLYGQDMAWLFCRKVWLSYWKHGNTGTSGDLDMLLQVARVAWTCVKLYGVDWVAWAMLILSDCSETVTLSCVSCIELHVLCKLHWAAGIVLVELNCVDLLKLCVMLSVVLMGLCEKSKSCHGPVVAHGNEKSSCQRRYEFFTKF